MNNKQVMFTGVFCLIVGVVSGMLLNDGGEGDSNISPKACPSTNQIQRGNSNIEDESALLITKLQKEVLLLKDALITANETIERLNEGRLALSTKTIYSENKLESQSNKASLIKLMSNEEIISSLPEPFYEYFIDNLNISLHSKYSQFTDEKIDSSWAEQMQIELEEFILTSNRGHQVELDSIICKSSICEIRGFEIESNTWSAIMNDMQLKGVGSFSSTHSASKTSQNEEKYFYALLSR